MDNILHALEKILEERKSSTEDKSYVSSLYSKGVNSILEKVSEESGNYQDIVEIFTDCDQDVILLKVNQKGGIACHTGRANCFFNKLENDQWKSVSEVIKDPKEIYG